MALYSLTDKDKEIIYLTRIRLKVKEGFVAERKSAKRVICMLYIVNNREKAGIMCHRVDKRI
jgi:hypothetical protein